MKLSLNWLKDYVDPKLSTDELVHRLTMAGLEVEEVHAVGKDTVLDLEITPNRPDCLNTIGLAREIAAMCSKDLHLPKIKPIKATTKDAVSVTIQDKKDCPRYTGTTIRNVKIAAAPASMVQHLDSMGIRSISNAVDITNFVLMEMGQPLHVFDLDKLEGGKIVVRRAKEGEKIITLDGIERKLDPSVLVIADAVKPVAIAGIMGGMDTQVTETTTNILLESAQFDMGMIRRASRALGLKSDSSYRFERGIDVDNVLSGADRASGLLSELTGGKIAGRFDAGQKTLRKKQVITISLGDIEGLLGTKVTAALVKNAMTRLGAKVVADKKGSFKIAVPGFRGDLKQKVDIIEEVARIIGYDNLDVSFPNIQVLNISPDIRPRNVRKIVAKVMTSKGYHESITYSLICQKDLDQCGLNLQGVLVDNALSGEHNMMRPHLLPSLLSVAATNFSRGQRELRIFETGKCYFADGERWTLGVLATGRRDHDWRVNSRAPIELSDVKGALEQIFDQTDANVRVEAGDFPGLDSGAAILSLNGKAIGAVGLVPKKVLSQWGIKFGDVYFAQVDLQSIFALPKAIVKYEPIAEFPGITRDISIALKREIPYSMVSNCCERLGGAMLRHIHLVEEYTGEKVDSAHRGLVLSLLYQSKERTLRDDEVNAVHQRIVETLIKEMPAVQR